MAKIILFLLCLFLLDLFGKPKAHSPAIFLIRSPVLDTEISLLCHTQVDLHRDVEKGEQDQEGGAHQKRDDKPERKFTNRLRMAYLLIDIPIHPMLSLGSKGLLPGVFYTPKHEVRGRDTYDQGDHYGYPSGPREGSG